jgi:polar amino acid transport system permease protein
MSLDDVINLRWFLVGGFPQNVLGGLALNIVVGTLAFIFSFIFGHILALGRVGSIVAVRWACTCYIELVRAVPLVIVLFWFYFALPILLQMNPSPFWSALAALTAYAAAYQAEFIRSGIKGVAIGEIEAARSLGLSRAQVLLSVVLAQAHRRMIPTYASYYTSLFKDSSVLYIVGLVELLQAGLIVAERHPGRMLEVYLAVAVLFFIVCSGASWLGQWLTRWLTPIPATSS